MNWELDNSRSFSGLRTRGNTITLNSKLWCLCVSEVGNCEEDLEEN